MNRKGRILMTMLSAIVLSLWSSCTPDELSGPEAAHIATTFSLTSPSAMDGKVTIEDAYLKLHHIDVIGSNHVLNHPIPAEEPPYRLSEADTSQVGFNLPSRSFNQLTFDLYLFQDTYELIINEVNETPAEPNDGADEENDTEGHNGNENKGDNDTDTDDQGDDDGDNDDGDNDDGDNDDDDNDNDDDDNDDDDNDDDDNDDDDDDDEDEGDEDDEDEGDEDDSDKGNKDSKNNDDDEDDGRKSNNHATSVDIDHFFQNAKPGLVVIGTYQNNNKILKIIFIVDRLEKVSLQGRQNDSPTIMLNKQNTAAVNFDLENWFESITVADIESASIQTHQGQEIVFIHRNFNTHLFEPLILKLEGSAGLDFTASSDAF